MNSAGRHLPLCFAGQMLPASAWPAMLKSTQPTLSRAATRGPSSAPSAIPPPPPSAATTLPSVCNAMWPAPTASGPPTTTTARSSPSQAVHLLLSSPSCRIGTWTALKHRFHTWAPLAPPWSVRPLASKQPFTTVNLQRTCILGKTLVQVLAVRPTSLRVRT